MRAISKQAHLTFSGTSANINKEWKVTSLYIKTHTFHKFAFPLAFHTNQPYLVLVKLVVPVAFTIRAGTNSIMRDPAFAQCSRQAVKQHRFPCVGWPTKQYSG